MVMDSVMDVVIAASAAVATASVDTVVVPVEVEAAELEASAVDAVPSTTAEEAGGNSYHTPYYFLIPMANHMIAF